MHILLQDRNCYNLIDITNKRSTGWRTNIPTYDNFINNHLHSWGDNADNPLTFINYAVRTGYTIMSIDDIPFSEWSIQHPEFFI